MVTVLYKRINVSRNFYEPWKINEVNWQGFVKCIYHVEIILFFNNFMYRQDDTDQDELVNLCGGFVGGKNVFDTVKKAYASLSK
jgi:hypothetical protein